MTPADSLSLILRRLDEIERKLDPHAGRAKDPQRPPAIRHAEAITQGR